MDKMVRISEELHAKLTTMKLDYDCKTIEELIGLFIDKEEKILNKFKE